MSQEEEADKPHEPTQRKLDEARRKGEIPRSQDLSTAATYGGLILAAMAVGADSLHGLGTGLMSLLDRADRLDALFFADHGARAPAAGLIGLALTGVLPFLAVPAAAALLTILAQRAFVVTPDKLRPKLSRISVLKNAKNKFGRNGLFEFTKSFAKLVIYSVLLGVFLSSRLDRMAGSLRTDPGIATAILLRLCVEFLAVVLVISLAIGAIDYLWQRAEHLRRHRMSDKEIRDEQKEAEGDPHMKGERRSRGQAIAQNRMLADVPTADVVITNPTHYAIALKWARTPGSAPVCVAKGTDEIAARIREIAQQNAVPLHRDPPTARALFAMTEIGQEVPASHYRAVATAIRFADAMRLRARKGWR